MLNVKLKSMMFCENTQMVKTQDVIKTNLVAPFNNLSLKYLPTYYSFVIVSSVEFCDDKINNLQTIKLLINDSEGIEIFNTGDMSIPQEAFENCLSLKVFNFNLDIRNLEFKGEGKYTVKLYFDNEYIDDSSFLVSQKD